MPDLNRKQRAELLNTQPNPKTQMKLSKPVPRVT
eukprot:UN07374